MRDDRRKAIMDAIGKRQDHAMKRLGLYRPKMPVGGRLTGKSTLAIKALRDAIEEKNPGPYYAYLPRRLAKLYTQTVGGRIEPCQRERHRAYDEIVGHNEGDVIILVEKA